MELPNNRYIANLLVEQQVVHRSEGNNIRALTSKLLDMFEEKNHVTNAIIFDNDSGSVLLQCDKKKHS